MGTFGERLRREREMRGITLDEIAEATKIGARSLRALEAEEFEKLPGGIFNKGFVRAYARYLGIDEEQAIADYLAAAKETVEPAAESKPIDPHLPAASESVPEESTETHTPWAAFAAILVIAALAAGGWYLYKTRFAPPAEPVVTVPAPSTAPPTLAPPSAPPPPLAASQVTPPPNQKASTSAPAPTTAVTEKQAPAAPELASAGDDRGAGFVLHIRAVQDSWMHITADGKVVLDGILTASKEKDVRAQNQIVLTTGNAGGVEISHNGKALAPLGPEKKTRTVTFTPEGLQQ